MSYIPQDAIEKMIRDQVEPLRERIRTLERQPTGDRPRFITPVMAIMIVFAILTVGYGYHTVNVWMPMVKRIMSLEERMDTLEKTATVPQ